MCVCIYIYICIMCVYIRIYMMCVCIYIYNVYVLVIIIGSGLSYPGSNPGSGYSHSSNTLGKVMHLIILLQAMDKIVGQTELFSLGIATNVGEGKL